MTATTKNSFITVVLGKLNKSEKQIQQESVERFVEDATIDCEEQISALTAEIHRAKNNVTRLEKAVARAKEALNNTKYSTASNFAAWVDGINGASKTVYSEELNLQGAQQTVTQLEGQKAEFEALLTILK